MIYFPVRGGDVILLRTAGDPAALASVVRRELHALDNNLRAPEISTIAEIVDRAIVRERLIARLSGFFGVLALLLAAVIYGVTAYAVARRTHEMGVRMALGAQRRHVLRLVLRETLTLAITGAGIGIAAALRAVRLIKSLLFGLEPVDPLTFLVASAMLLSVAVLSGLLPARRASALDPMVALRYE